MSDAQDAVGDRHEADAPAARFRIFRASDAEVLGDHNMPTQNITPTDEAGIAQSSAAGAGEGAFAKVLFADPASGMSVGYVWFKPGFILPRHSHDAVAKTAKFNNRHLTNQLRRGLSDRVENRILNWDL